MQIHAASKGKVALYDIKLWVKRCTKWHVNTISRFFHLIAYYVSVGRILPRDAMRKPAVYAVARCLSVTLVHCIQTAESIAKLLSRRGSHIILVF